MLEVTDGLMWLGLAALVFVLLGLTDYDEDNLD